MNGGIGGAGRVEGTAEAGAPPKANRQSEEDQQTIWIDDAEFMRTLAQLKRLRAFLIREAVPLQADEASKVSLGALNQMRSRIDKVGRAPTLAEWHALESRQETLFLLLSEPLRKKYVRGNVPMWIAVVPALFAVAAASALTVSIQKDAAHWTMTVAYLTWILSSGAIGSIAFIGMNALSLQDDATFDLNNSKLMALRVVLGMMFALMLSLPFGYPYYLQFLDGLRVAKSGQPGAAPPLEEAFYLLLPFVLGFSTSLVILVLNRLVAAAETFFGRVAPAARPEADVRGRDAGAARAH